MKRVNQLSNNLKVYQQERKKTLAELAEELDIAKSTLYSILVSGNATIDTLIRIANALDVSLDVLVFGRLAPSGFDKLFVIIPAIGWYARLPAHHQGLFRYHLIKILQLLQTDQN